MQSHVAGHKSRRDVGAQRPHGGVAVGAEVVVDSERERETAVLDSADVAAHDRELLHTFGEGRVSPERGGEIGHRSDCDEFEVVVRTEQACDGIGAGLGFGGRHVSLCEDALALVSGRGEAAAGRHGLTAPGVHGHVVSPGEGEEALRDSGAVMGIAAHRRDGDELDLRRSQSKGEAHGVVDVRAHIGVKQDAVCHVVKASERRVGGSRISRSASSIAARELAANATAATRAAPIVRRMISSPA